MIFLFACNCFTLVLLAPSLAFPLSQQEGLDKLNNLQNKFEVVEGPTEFVMPVIPLKDSVLTRHVARDEDSSQLAPLPDKASDLDYMVYGKLYLLKALNITEKSLDINKHMNENPRFRIGVPDLKVNYNDGIAFPTTLKPIKRSYQYKAWSNLESLSSHKHGHSNHRKLEERSADQIDTPVKSLPLSTTVMISTTTTPSTHEIVDAKQPSSLDEEASELLQKLLPQQPLVDETSAFGNETDGATQGDITATKSSTDDIEFGERFLINVPAKPNFVRCPEGQKRAHNGACKAILSVPKLSRYDGVYAGRIYATNITQRKEHNSSSMHRRREDIPIQLTSLFRSVVQFERQLEKAIKESEKQMSEMIKDEHGSSTVTTDESKQS